MTKEQIDSFLSDKQQRFVQQQEKEQQALVNLYELEVNACSFIRKCMKCKRLEEFIQIKN